jgi:hypothetical protein
MPVKKLRHKGRQRTSATVRPRAVATIAADELGRAPVGSTVLLLLISVSRLAACAW